MTDNEYADIMMTAAYAVQQAPAEARQRLLAARDRVADIRARLCSLRAVRYDRDRVQTSTVHDLSDDLGDLQEAEHEVWVAETLYLAAIASLRYCCLAAGFGRRQTDIWTMYYGYGHSLGSIALMTGLTKSQVQYLTSGVRASRDFCLGIGRIAEAAV